MAAASSSPAVLCQAWRKIKRINSNSVGISNGNPVTVMSYASIIDDVISRATALKNLSDSVIGESKDHLVEFFLDNFKTKDDIANYSVAVMLSRIEPLPILIAYPTGMSTEEITRAMYELDPTVDLINDSTSDAAPSSSVELSLENFLELSKSAKRVLILRTGDNASSTELFQGV